jgi:hypothetical protein
MKRDRTRSVLTPALEVHVDDHETANPHKLVPEIPRKLYREDCSLKPVTELDDDAAMALAGFEVVEMAGSLQACVKAHRVH